MLYFFNLNSEAKKILGKKEWSKLYSPDIEREFHSGPIETKGNPQLDRVD